MAKITALEELTDTWMGMYNELNGMGTDEHSFRRACDPVAQYRE